MYLVDLGADSYENFNFSYDENDSLAKISDIDNDNDDFIKEVIKIFKGFNDIAVVEEIRRKDTDKDELVFIRNVG